MGAATEADTFHAECYRGWLALTSQRSCQFCAAQIICHLLRRLCRSVSAYCITALQASLNEGQTIKVCL